MTTKRMDALIQRLADGSGVSPDDPDLQEMARNTMTGAACQLIDALADLFWAIVETTTFGRVKR